MDPQKARINEIRFLELCTRIISHRGRNSDLSKFFSAINMLIDFDLNTIVRLSTVIFSKIYQPTTNEFIRILTELGMNRTQISRIVGISVKTIYNRFDTVPEILYPRTTPEEQEAVDKFFQQYDVLFETNYTNLA